MQLEKVESLGSSFNIFTVLDGIPRKDSYVIFTGVVYMMACKCKLNGETVAPHVCFSWPKIVKNCLSWPDFLALPLLNGLRGHWPMRLTFHKNSPFVTKMATTFLCVGDE